MHKFCNKIVYILVLAFIFFANSYIFAKGFQISTGFKKDDYGTCYYYEEDKYYRDGFHTIDNNNDGIFQYVYFTLSGHILKNAIAPNGCTLNSDGYLTINDVVYEVPTTDILAGLDIFHGKIETENEIKIGFKIDYSQAFDKWFIDSSNDINNKLASIADNLTIQKVNKVKDEISNYVRDIKKISKWYEERLYSAKLDNIISKELYKEMKSALEADMSSYVNNFRNQETNVIKSMGY